MVTLSTPTISKSQLIHRPIQFATVTIMVLLIAGMVAASKNARPDGRNGSTRTIGTPTATPYPINADLVRIASPLVPVQGGTFLMGTTVEEGLTAVAACVQIYAGSCTDNMITDSIPAHEVPLDDFQIELYEVTVGQYVDFLNDLLRQDPDSRPHLAGCNGALCALTAQDTSGEASDLWYNARTHQYHVRYNKVNRSNYPITLVTWQGADAYCKALGRFLPTEAQWERAARGPDNTIYPWGELFNDAYSKTNKPIMDGPVAVDAYADDVSGFGVYDMAGNVAEWTADWYQADFYTQPEASGPNPQGPTAGEKKVIRGGAWNLDPLFARAVHRIDSYEPDNVSTWVGFRCAAAVED